MKHCTFSTQIDKDGLFLKPKCLQKSENYRAPNFFPRRPKFCAKQAEKFWHELATRRARAAAWGGRALAAAGTLYRNVCSTSVSQSATAVWDKESPLSTLQSESSEKETVTCTSVCSLPKCCCYSSANISFFVRFSVKSSAIVEFDK